MKRGWQKYRPLYLFPEWEGHSKGSENIGNMHFIWRTDGETNPGFISRKNPSSMPLPPVRDETCLTPAVCMMWWAVDPGFSTYPWNRWEQIIVTLHVSISKEDIIAFQLLEMALL
jgi:hypothetical protein